MAQFQEADLAGVEDAAAPTVPPAPEEPAVAAKSSRRRPEAPPAVDPGPWWSRKSVWSSAVAGLAGLGICGYLASRPAAVEDLADDEYPEITADLGAPAEPLAFTGSAQQVASWNPDDGVEHAYAQAPGDATATGGPALGPQFPGEAERAVHFASEEQPEQVQPIRHEAGRYEPARSPSPAWLPGTIEIDFDSPARGSYDAVRTGRN